MRKDYYEDPIDGTVVEDNPQETKKAWSVSDSFIGKVYAYFALALGIAGVVGIVLGLVLDNYLDINTVNGYLAQMIIMVVSIVMIVVMTFVMNIKSVKAKNSVTLLAIYALFWGLFLGSLVFYVGDALVLGGAFLIAALVFLGASIIGYYMRNKAHKVAYMVLGGLAIGAVLCSLLTFVFIPLMYGGYTEAYWGVVWLYLIIEVIMVVYMAVIVALDTHKIKKMSEANAPLEVKNSLAVSCATNLFGDFIYIFLRIVYLLLFLGVGKRRN